MENQGFWLSPQQEHSWSLDPELRTAAYRVQAVVRVNGTLDGERLHTALLDVVSQQDVLRTVFRRQPGMKVPFQVISREALLDWQSVDLLGLSEQEQDSRISEFFVQEKENVFDLESGPPLRARLLRFTSNRHALILSLPALCGDAGTLQNLVREL